MPVSSAHLVRRVRTGAGLTQRGLAGRLGVPQSTVARWETGAAEPSFERLQQVAAACGLEVAVRLVPHDLVTRTEIRRAVAATPLQRLRTSAAAGRLILRGRRALRRRRGEP